MSRTTPFVAVSFALALCAGVLTSAPAEAQSNAGKKSGPVMKLTPLDYVEIRQLAARYAHAVDQGADDGYAYADLFAPGANFGKRPDGTTLPSSRSRPAGARRRWHFIVNHVIEPTEDGAKGREYMLHLRTASGTSRTRSGAAATTKTRT